MTDNKMTYRQYLQFHANNHESENKRKEAQALLNVVGGRTFAHSSTTTWAWLMMTSKSNVMPMTAILRVWELVAPVIHCADSVSACSKQGA